MDNKAPDHSNVKSERHGFKAVALRYVPAALILLILTAFFGQKLNPADGTFIGGIDIASQLWWTMSFIKSEFAAGRLPLWNPHYYCGHPFLANPSTSVFYPATLLFIAFPLPWAFTLDMLLHLFLAATGAYVFTFRLTRSKQAGLIAALVYALSGYFLARISVGHIYLVRSAAFFPWHFVLIDKYFDAGKSAYLMLSGLLLGIQFLGGGPQNDYYTALFISVYFISRMASPLRPFHMRRFLKTAGCFICIPAFALGTSAIQIIPTLEFAALSDRVKNTYAFATQHSFPLKNLFTLLVPLSGADERILNTNWELTAYAGILSLLLAFIGGMLPGESVRKRPFYLLIFVALTLMFGAYTPIYRIYYAIVPGLSNFRVPARCAFVFIFCIAVFAAYGFRRLETGRFTGKQQLTVMITTAALFVCLFAGAKGFHIPFSANEILKALIILALSALFFALARRFPLPRLLAAAAVLILLTDFALTFRPSLQELSVKDLTTKHPYEKLFSDDNGYYRVAVPTDPQRGACFGYENLNGYTNLAIGDFYKFVHETAELRMYRFFRHTLSQDLFRTGRVFSSKILNVKYALIQSPSGPRLLMAESFMPRALLVKNPVVMPHEEQLQAIKNPDFDYRNTLLLPPGTRIPDTASTGLVTEGLHTVVIDSYAPDRITLTANSAGPSYLLLSELYYPGWKAYLDGREVPVLKADYLLRAIRMPTGKHKVLFKYAPQSLVTGGIITLATLLAGICGILLSFKKRI